MALIKASWPRLLLGHGVHARGGATTAASAFLVKPVLDDIFFKKNVRMLKLIPLVVILIHFLRGFGYYGQEYFMSFVGQNIIRRLRNRLYGILDLPLSFFHKEKTGTLMSRITNDVNIIRTMVSTVVTGALRDAFTILGLTAVIFYRDWKMALCPGDPAGGLSAGGGVW